MRREGSPNARTARAEATLRDAALQYPEVHEDFPWGERAMKVKGKVFLFMYAGPDGLSLSTKLPQTGLDALAFPFAKPTGYGLGKAGWVSAAFGADEDPPIALLLEWLDESYRAVAPKKLAQALPAPSAPARPAKTAAKASPKKKTATSRRK